MDNIKAIRGSVFIRMCFWKREHANLNGYCRMRKIAGGFILLLSLLGCASVEIDRSAADFDDTKYGEDLNTCRGGHILAATLETAKYGTVGGAVGAVHGLSYWAYSDSMAGVLVGAVAGSVLGTGAGVFQGVKDRETEIARCLRDKGYTIVHQGA